MAGRVWLPPLMIFAFLLGPAAAFAQSVGPDEAVNAAHDGLSQKSRPYGGAKERDL